MNNNRDCRVGQLTLSTFLVKLRIRDKPPLQERKKVAFSLALSCYRGMLFSFPVSKKLHTQSDWLFGIQRLSKCKPCNTLAKQITMWPNFVTIYRNCKKVLPIFEFRGSNCIPFISCQPCPTVKCFCCFLDRSCSGWAGCCQFSGNVL